MVLGEWIEHHRRRGKTPEGEEFDREALFCPNQPSQENVDFIGPSSKIVGKLATFDRLGAVGSGDGSKTSL